MTNETNAERLETIKQDAMRLTDSEGIADDVVQLDEDSYEWLIERAELAQELEQSTTVHVIKRRNGKATTIGWNGERYVYQSESTARGGHHNGKR